MKYAHVKVDHATIAMLVHRSVYWNRGRSILMPFQINDFQVPCYMSFLVGCHLDLPPHPGWQCERIRLGFLDLEMWCHPGGDDWILGRGWTARCSITVVQCSLVMHPGPSEIKLVSLVGGWTNPCHLKNMLVKLGSSSPIFGVKIPKILELPPTSSFAITPFHPTLRNVSNLGHPTHIPRQVKRNPG